MYSYKECEKALENRKLKITELMEYLLKMRKRISICFVALFLVLLCCFVIKYKSTATSEAPVTLEQLDERQQKRVKSTLKLYSELENMDDYKANSAYMSLNPFQCDIVTIQYLISADDEKIEKAAYESYKNYISYGEVKEIVNAKLGEKINTPSDLIEIADKINIDDNEIIIGKNNICVKVVASDFDSANEIIQIVKGSITDYYATVKKNVGDHSIEVLSESSYSGKDERVLEKQELIEKNQNDKRQQIINLENSLTSQEKTVLENEKNNIENTVISEENEKNILFYILVSFVFSIFFTLVVFSGYYLFNNKLKSSREMMDVFGILGFDLKSSDNNKLKMISKEIELICKNNSIKNVLFVLMEDNQKRVNVDICKIVENIKLESGKIKIVSNILKDINSLETIEGYNDIILVPVIYKTTYNEIFEMIQKCEKYNRSIIASVIL